MSFLSKVASVLSGTGYHYDQVMSKQNDFNKSYNVLLSNRAAIADYNKQLLEIVKVLEDKKYEGLETKYEEMNREFNKKYDGMDWDTLLKFSKGLVEKMQNNIDDYVELKEIDGKKLSVSILKEKKLVFEYVENNYKNFFKYKEEQKELLECKKLLIEKKIIMSDYRSIKISIGGLETKNISLESECNHKQNDVNTAQIHRRNHSKNR